MNPTKTRIKDILWHGCKALLCAAQLWVFHLVTMISVGNLKSFLYTELVVRKGEPSDALLSLIHPVTLILLFFFLWRYYDNVDDRSFNQFCETYKDRTEAPFLLKESRVTPRRQSRNRRCHSVPRGSCPTRSRLRREGA